MGVREPKQTDRRVLRSRRMLREALLQLILERGWDAISVQDVCDRADVGRSTFYLHFADKEDLLLSGFAQLREELRAHRDASAPQGKRPLSFTLPLFEHAREHLKLYRALIGKRTGQAVEKHLLRLVMDFVREDVGASSAAGPRLDAVVHYVAGAFLEVMRWWFASRNPMPPADLDDLFHRLTASALTVAKAR